MPYIPDPGRQYAFIDQGQQTFNYSLLPHEGSWEEASTVQRAAELNQQPIALLETYHPEGTLPLNDSFLSIDRANVVATVLKKAEDNDDLILRCIETSKEATQATICLPKWNRIIQAEFGPCEIKTFRIPHDRSLPAVETNLLEWEAF
jgi:alpha-mannosidase